MEPILFETRCPSCQARLVVRDDRLLNQIIACPKCGGMVLIQRPDPADSDPHASTEIVYTEQDDFYADGRGDILSAQHAPPPFLLPQIPPETEDLFLKTPLLDTGPAGQLPEFAPPVADPQTVSIPESPRVKLPNIPIVAHDERISPTTASHGGKDGEYIEDEESEPELDDAEGEGEEEDEDGGETNGVFFRQPWFVAALGMIAGLLFAIVLLLLTIRPDLHKKETLQPPHSPYTSNVEESTDSSDVGVTVPDGAVSDAVTPDIPLLDSTVSESPSTETSAQDSDGGSVPAEPTEVSEDEILLTDAPLPESRPADASPEDSPTTQNAETAGTEEFEVSVSVVEPLLPPVFSVGKLDARANLSERLAIPVEALSMPNQRLPEFLTLLGGLTGLDVTLDLDAVTDPVQLLTAQKTLELGPTTAREILDRSSALFELTWREIDGGVLLVPTDSDAEKKVERLLDVSDLVGSSAGAGLPAEEKSLQTRILPKLISTEILAQMLDELLGADATVFPGEATGTLRLIAPRREARMAEKLLEQLRTVRNLPEKEHFEPEELLPETLGLESLSESRTLQFLRPVPLRTALTVLARAEKKIWFTDAQALRMAGVSPETKIRILAQEQPAGDILTEMVGSLGLTWRIPAHDVILITSKEEAARHEVVMLHLYAIPGTPAAETSEGVIERLMRLVEPKSWLVFRSEADPHDETPGEQNAKTGATAVLWADPVSATLFVRQTEPNQRLVRRLLTEALAQGGGPAPHRPEDSETPGAATGVSSDEAVL